MATAILRIGKLKTTGDVAAALDHARRERREVPNADPQKKNVTLVDGNFDIYKNKIDGVKIRSNAVLCYDILMTTSPDFWDKEYVKGREASHNAAEWIKGSRRWLNNEFGKDNIVHTVIHLDEKTPHLQAIVVPKLNGKLNAKAWTGGSKKLSEIQDRYYEEIKASGLKRGLKGSRAQHQTIRQFYQMAQAEAVPLPKPQAGELATDYCHRVRHVLDVLEYQAREGKIVAKQVKDLRGQIELIQKLCREGKFQELRDFLTPRPSIGPRQGPAPAPANTKRPVKGKDSGGLSL